MFPLYWFQTAKRLTRFRVTAHESAAYESRVPLNQYFRTMKCGTRGSRKLGPKPQKMSELKPCKNGTEEPYSASNGPAILAPGFEIPTKGMQEHYPLCVGCGGTLPRKDHRQNEEQSCPTDAIGVCPGTQVGPLHYNPQFRHRTLRSLRTLTNIGRTAIR